ncbi:hypothetical protein ACFYYB_35170 [Streptomyces sp. NPDC002886]|uniref:hypothetical protein n=1 Tax=Streptomyces sp. NPDC002886 TaxID=3364667 RepID=UPI0036A7E63E
MKGFRTAMTVIGAAVALGVLGTAVAPVAASAAPAARAAVVVGAVPDAWVEVSNGTHSSLDDLKPVCKGETMFVGGPLKAYGLSGYGDGTWRVRHVDTDAQHFASTSHTVYLDVRGGTAPCAAE